MIRVYCKGSPFGGNKSRAESTPVFHSFPGLFGPGSEETGGRLGQIFGTFGNPSGGGGGVAAGPETGGLDPNPAASQNAFNTQSPQLSGIPQDRLKDVAGNLNPQELGFKGPLDPNDPLFMAKLDLALKLSNGEDLGLGNNGDMSQRLRGESFNQFLLSDIPGGITFGGGGQPAPPRTIGEMLRGRV